MSSFKNGYKVVVRKMNLRRWDLFSFKNSLSIIDKIKKKKI